MTTKVEPSRSTIDQPSLTAASSLVRSALGVGIATTAASGANYLSNVLLGRSLGPTAFADAALVVSGLLLLSALALGFQLTVARDLAAGGTYRRLAVVRRHAALTGIGVGTCLALLSPVLRPLFNMASVWPLVFLGVSVPLFFVLAVMRGAVQARQAFGRLSASLAIEAFTRLGVVVAVIIGHAGATGVAIALSLSFLAALVPCYGVVTSDRLAHTPTRDVSARPSSHSVPHVGSHVGSRPSARSAGMWATILLLVGQVIISNSDIWIVAARLPDQAGSYAAVALIGRLVFIAAWSIITVVFPSLVNGGMARRGLLWKAAAAIAVFGGVLVVLAAVFGERLITAMMGAAYASVGGLLWQYALATALFVVANLFAVDGVARGDVRPPAMMVVAAIAQILVLTAGAAHGIEWVVRAQVVLMSVALVCVISLDLLRGRTVHPPAQPWAAPPADARRHVGLGAPTSAAPSNSSDNAGHQSDQPATDQPPTDQPATDEPLTDQAGVPNDADALSVRRIKQVVGIVFFVAALIVFRDVLFAIPSILRGDSVIVGDELVPFFNPKTQLLDQAAGEFSDLTHGYEFRVRYSFLTTWLRHYLVLPFAVLIVIPAVFYSAYLSTARFVSRVFTMLTPQAVYLATFFPVTLMYMIVTYAKITHFYTLIVGLALFTAAVLDTLYALLFARSKWIRTMTKAAALVLLNPAVHYLILYVLFFALTVTTLLVGEIVRAVRLRRQHKRRRFRRHQELLDEPVADSVSGRVEAPAVVNASVEGRLTPSAPRHRRRDRIRQAADSVTGRCFIGGFIVLFVALVPYALFVKFLALRGVPNLSETVPGDYYFISDASVSWLHLVSWDLAGITDKLLYGDYLAKVPRWRNLPYTLLLVVPLLVRPITRRLFVTRAHRQLLAVLYVVIGFSFWASIGYAQPSWVPSFHRTITHLSLAADSSNTKYGDLTLTVTSTLIQVLRFPHRFQLMLFTLGPMVMTMTLAVGIDALSGRLLGLMSRRRGQGRSISPRRAAGDRLVTLSVSAVWLGLVFFAPFLSNSNYRQVYASGDFGTFLAPYPTGDLKALKQHMLALPVGKTVVLPPTETSKRVLDANGIDHKLIDKFYIYYLDQPSYYYGLTGDSTNKFEFFLMMRGLYYQQDWWINIARDLDIRYIVADRSMHGNGGVGAEYLPGLETLVEPALQFQSDKFALRYENTSFALYELIDPPLSRDGPPRPTLLIDSSWSTYLDTVYERLDLSRCYDFQYLPYYKPAAAAVEPDDGGPAPLPRPVTVLTDDPTSAAIDMYLLANQELVGTPDQKIFAFNPNIVASSYYLSPMFREFLLFSNTTWNRTDIITPGVFGTLRGSFIGVPRGTHFDINVNAPAAGKYRVFLRAAVTANELDVSSDGLGYDESFVLRPAPKKVEFYTADSVYTKNRQAVDLSTATPAEVNARLDDDLVAANLAYEYHDLGIVDATAGGGYQFSISKHDDNPLLVDSMALIPVDEADALLHGPDPLGPNYTVADSAEKLWCNERLPVRDNNVGFVDSAAHGPNEDLSNEELIDLAAAGVDGLEAPNYSNNGTWIVALLETLFILLFGVALIAWRLRRDDGEVQMATATPYGPEPTDVAGDDMKSRNASDVVPAASVAREATGRAVSTLTGPDPQGPTGDASTFDLPPPRSLWPAPYSRQWAAPVSRDWAAPSDATESPITEFAPPRSFAPPRYLAPPLPPPALPPTTPNAPTEGEEP